MMEWRVLAPGTTGGLDLYQSLSGGQLSLARLFVNQLAGKVWAKVLGNFFLRLNFASLVLIDSSLAALCNLQPSALGQQSYQVWLCFLQRGLLRRAVFAGSANRWP